VFLLELKINNTKHTHFILIFYSPSFIYVIFSVWYETTCQEEKSVRGRKDLVLLTLHFLEQSSTYWPFKGRGIQQNLSAKNKYISRNICENYILYPSLSFSTTNLPPNPLLCQTLPHGSCISFMVISCMRSDLHEK
jgi:hypothetical protein